MLAYVWCAVENIQWLAGSTGEAAGAMPTAAANTQRDLTRSGGVSTVYDARTGATLLDAAQQVGLAAAAVEISANSGSVSPRCGWQRERAWCARNERCRKFELTRKRALPCKRLGGVWNWQHAL